MVDANLPIGTQIRSPHGNRWEKVGPNDWRVLGDWGAMDNWTSYLDADVFGEEVHW